jgi:hypothetical protein
MAPNNYTPGPNDTVKIEPSALPSEQVLDALPKMNEALTILFSLKGGRIFTPRQVVAQQQSRRVREFQRQSLLSDEQKELEQKEADLRDQMFQKRALEVKAWNDAVEEKRSANLTAREGNQMQRILAGGFVNKSVLRRSK